MRTLEHKIPIMTIEAFAEKHDLTMEVHERRRASPDPARFYAHFEDAELMDGGMLVGTHGNGSTEAEAIQDYAEKISLGRLAVGALKSDRRNIDVPRLQP